MTLQECKEKYPINTCFYYKNYSNLVCIVSGYFLEDEEAYPAYVSKDIFIPIKDVLDDDNFLVRYN